MKKVLLLFALIIVAVIAWQIGEKLSSDAISMGIGVLFGVLAGVPTALILLVSSRNRRSDEGPDQSHGAYPAYPQLAAQPPVIVVTGQGGPAQSAMQQSGFSGAPAQQGWEHPRPERKFKVVGEQEGWVEDW